MPSSVPTSVPTAVSTSIPSVPSSEPSASPISLPTSVPSEMPTSIPTSLPTSSFTHANIDMARLNGVGFSIHGRANQMLGYFVTSLGDINKDGIDDILVGAPYNSQAVKTAYVIYGRAGGNADINILSINYRQGFLIFAEEVNDALGHAACGIGDVNGDGINDFAVSAPFSSGRGAVYVIYGKSGYRDSVNLVAFGADEGYVISGSLLNSRTGYRVASVGDVNGDYIRDVIVAAPFANQNTGMTYLIYGRSHWFNVDVDLDSWSASMGIVFHGSMGKCQSGSQVVAIGDFNGDGTPDFAIGEPLAFADYSGAVRIVLGCAYNCYSDEVRLSDQHGYGFSVVGKGWLSRVGAVMSAGGDINNDGLSDFLIGVPSMNNNEGAIFVIYGNAAHRDVYLAELQPSQGYMIRGIQGSEFGLSVAGNIDFNHDNRPDFVIGSVQQMYVAILGNRRIGSLASLSVRDGYFMSVGAAGQFTSAIGDINGDGFVDFAISTSARNNSGVVHIVYDIYGTSEIEVTHHPVISPTVAPTVFPTRSPTKPPTNFPSKLPTALPTHLPSLNPTKAPSVTPYPTPIPSQVPTIFPSRAPTCDPTTNPTRKSSPYPSTTPSSCPSFAPNLTARPTPHPTSLPTVPLSLYPTLPTPEMPTLFPTSELTLSFPPSTRPPVSVQPSFAPKVTTPPTLLSTEPPPPMKHGYVTIHVSSCEDYYGTSSDEHIFVSLRDCSLLLSGLGGRHIYSVLSAPHSTVTIRDFNLSSDVIDIRSY